MAVDIETIGVGMETSGLVSGKAALDAVTESANRAADSADKLSEKQKTINAQNAMMSPAFMATADAARKQAEATKELAERTQAATEYAGRFADRIRDQADIAGKTKLELDKQTAATLGLTQQLKPYFDQIEQATTATHKFSLANAGVTRELAIMTGEVLRGNYNRLIGSTTVLANRTGIMTMAISALTSPLGLATAGFVAAGAAIAGIIVYYESHDRALAHMEQQLAATGRASSFTNSELNGLITTVAKAPGVTRTMAEEIVGSFTKVAGVSAEMTDQLAKLTPDFAAGIGEKMPAAAKKLAEAFADPVQGVRTLDKELNLLNTTQLMAIESALRENDINGARAMMYAALEERVKGLADKGTELQQAIHSMTVAWDAISDSLAQSKGMTFARSLLSDIAGTMNWMITNKDDFAKVLSVLAYTPMGFMARAMQKDTSAAGGATGSWGNNQDDKRQSAIEAEKAALRIAEANRGIADQVGRYKQEQAALNVQLAASIKLHGEDSEQVHLLEAGIQGLQEKIDRKGIMKGAGAAVRDEVNSQIEELKRGNAVAQEAVKQNVAATASLYRQGTLSLEESVKRETELKLSGIDATRNVLEQELAITEKQKNSRRAQSALLGELAKLDQDRVGVQMEGEQRLAEARQKTEKAAADAQARELSSISGAAARYRAQADAIELQISGNGKLTSSIEEVTLAKLKQKQADLLLFDPSASADVRAAIQNEIDELNRLINKRKDLTSDQAAVKLAEKLNKSWDNSERHIEDGLYAAIGRGGAAGFKKLLDDVKQWFARLVLQPIIQPIAQFGASLINPGASNAMGLMGGTTGNLGSLSSLGSIGSGISAIGTSYTAGAAASVGVDAFGVGTIGSAGGVMSGMTAALGAIPVWGWAALGAAAIASFASKGGGPKTEGGYTSGGLSIAGMDIGGNMQGSVRGDTANAQSIGQGLSSAYASLATTLGLLNKKLDVGIFYSMDNAKGGTSMTQLQVTSSAGYNRSDRLGGIENVARGDDALKAALAEDEVRLLIDGLKKSDLPEQFKDVFNALGTTAGVDEMKAAIDRVTAARGQQLSLEETLFQLTSTDAEKLAHTREKERAATDPLNKARLEEVYALQDLKTATDAAAAAAAAAADKAKAIANEKAGLEKQIMQLTGDTAGLRKLELDALDAGNRSLQERIYALQDEATATQAANAANAAWAQSRLNDAIHVAQDRIDAQKALVDAGKGISDFIKQLTTGRAGTASPEQLLAATRTNYLADLSGARNGNVDASGRVTGSAQAYIDAQKGYTASGGATQAVISQVISELNGLPSVQSYQDQSLQLARQQLAAMLQLGTLLGSTALPAGAGAAVPRWSEPGWTDPISGAYHPPVPHYAAGTTAHPGGWAMVGERGPELAHLPAQTRVYTAQDTQRMMGGGASEAQLAKLIEVNERQAALIERLLAVSADSASRSLGKQDQLIANTAANATAAKLAAAAAPV
jgi:hypothetical protein